MRYWPVLLLALSVPATAEVFKCTVNGKTVYSDSKCAKNAERVAIEVQPPDQENALELKKQSRVANKIVDQSVRRTRTQDLQNQIRGLESDIAELENRMRGELGPLETRRRNAGTDRDRLRRVDRDIQRVSSGYQARIDESRQRLDGLRSELNSAPAASETDTASRDSTNEDISTDRNETTSGSAYLVSY